MLIHIRGVNKLTLIEMDFFWLLGIGEVLAVLVIFVRVFWVVYNFFWLVSLCCFFLAVVVVGYEYIYEIYVNMIKK